VQQQFLPDDIREERFWTPQENAAEAKHKERMDALWKGFKKE
jgi:putative ATPase